MTTTTKKKLRLLISLRYGSVLDACNDHKHNWRLFDTIWWITVQFYIYTFAAIVLMELKLVPFHFYSVALSLLHAFVLLIRLRCRAWKRSRHHFKQLINWSEQCIWETGKKCPEITTTKTINTTQWDRTTQIDGKKTKIQVIVLFRTMEKEWKQ